MSEFIDLRQILNSFLYSILGIVVFWVAFVILDKITPQKLWEEIVDKKNQPLATVVAAMCLGVAIIVAAAIH